MEVKFKVRFMDWQAGEVVNLSKAAALRYIGLGTCDAVKPPVKRKKKAPPGNKRAAAPKNK